MPDGQNQMQYSSAEPLKFLLEYQEYLNQVEYHLCGYKDKEIPVGPPTVMPDGTIIQNYETEKVKDKNVNAICRREDAKYVVNQFKKYLNKYCAMGDLNRDDIAEIAGDCIKSTYDYLIGYARDENGHKVNLSLLKADGYANFDSIYIYFTALKDAGLRNGVLATLQSQYTVVNNGMQEPQKRSVLGLGGNNKR